MSICPLINNIYRERTWNIIDKLGEIAKVNKKNIAQTSIRSIIKRTRGSYYNFELYPRRWLLEQPNIPSVIIGVKTMAQLEDNLGAVGWSLSPQQVSVIKSETSKIGKLK